MKATKYLGVSEGMTNLGKNKNEHLFVNKSLFRKELKDLISFSKNLDPNFFKMVHVAFERL